MLAFTLENLITLLDILYNVYEHKRTLLTSVHALLEVKGIANHIEYKTIIAIDLSL